MRRWLRRTEHLALAALAAAVAGGTAAGNAGAASAPVTVAVNVPTATSLSIAACATGSAATTLGVMLPGDAAVAGADCTVSFGSSNDTAMLKAYQLDRGGVAMYAQSNGVPDGAFNGNGEVISDLVSNDGARAGGFQPDGKLVVGGHCGSDICVVRYRTDGTPDPSWGVNGVRQTDLGAASEWIWGLAIQPDGKVVVGGATGNASYVARYDAFGTLDNGFGVNGVRTFTNDTSANGVSFVTLQPDGAIVAVGSIPANGGDIEVARITTTGEMDASFDGDGRVQLSYSAANEEGEAVAIAPDGSIVIVGKTRVGLYDEWLVGKLTAGGVLAGSGFDGDGWLTRNLGTGHDQAKHVEVMADGRIVVIGDAGNATTDIGIARYSSTGVPDATFASGAGYLVRDYSGASDTGYAGAVQGDGRIYVTGIAVMSGNYDFHITRFLENGMIDNSWHSDGVVTEGVSATGDGAFALALGPDGKVATIGASSNGTNDDFSAIVYRGGGTVSNFSSGVADWTSGTTGSFGACLRAVGASTSATWTVDANATCTAVNTDPWRPIPTSTADAGSKVAATSGSGVTTAQVSLRFGVRLGPSQAAGDYIAPIAFEAIAPNV